MAVKDAVLIEPERPADAAVILMHGLGADGHDFESLVPELDLPETPSIRWIFPHAPVRPVTVNGGHSMRAWYDITAIDPTAPEDEAGIRESARAIGAFIDAEIQQGVRADRIVLAGFSQGGAMALFTALRRAGRLAGLIALSCYLPLPGTLAAEEHEANRDIPIFMAHGSFDPVVPFTFGAAAREQLHAGGHDVEWHEYQMEHGVCQPEIADLRKWLLRVLGQDA
jgi:phospholipase/carboxylesterase